MWIALYSLHRATVCLSLSHRSDGVEALRWRMYIIGATHASIYGSCKAKPTRGKLRASCGQPAHDHIWRDSATAFRIAERFYGFGDIVGMILFKGLRVVAVVS